MVTVLMECRDQEQPLARSLAALVPGAVEGLIREVLVLDRGSTDGSARVAEAAGCSFLKDTDVGAALARARSDWIFLLEPGARPLERLDRPLQRPHGGGPGRRRVSRLRPIAGRR